MNSVFLAFDKDDLVLLRDGVDVLSPDEDAIAELAEDLSNRLSVRIEDGDFDEIEITSEEIEILISAMEIISPDELDGVRKAQDLEERLCNSYRLLEDNASNPDM